jgi:hypothetical protein
MVMNNFVLWDITQCSLLKTNRRFGGTSPKRQLTFATPCFISGDRALKNFGALCMSPYVTMIAYYNDAASIADFIKR